MIATRTWNRGQAEAIERRGRVFVSAGAGTGKTSVLIERVVRRLQEGTPLDHLLVITFTERAADELKRRIRVRLRELEMLDAEAAVESAWISTIHGLCARVLRAHALEAGIDPSFAVASDTEMRILQSEAFAQAVEAFGEDGDPARLDLLARYGQDRLRRIVAELHGRLRGVGLPLELRPHREPHPDSAEDAEEREAAADLALIEQLLVLFDRHYQAVKDLRGRLDFDDLELVARDLLRAKPEVAAGYRERFAEVMVDEFQDTNRLQVELVELVCGGDLFLVGDEFQSIYRFRRADVDVYREQRAVAGDAVIALDENYRSRPHVLDLVNEAYGREFGGGYHDLVAAGDFDGDPPAPEVELLLTDVRACREDDIAWRQAEAAAIARRVRELVDAEVCGAGGVVLLFEAGTDAGTYEDALQQQNLPTVRATGRGYYGQQEVGDLIAYLRLLINRTDDRALLSVLASPLVGMSNDGLGLIRLATRRAAAIGAFEPARWPQALSEADNRLGQAFKLRYDRLVERQPGYSLERLCEAIVAEHDFDLALLARPDGDRRLANVRKLVRLAREYEQLRGPDLEGFVRFCEEQADLAAREGEAAIADEGGDAVVLMTVHSAKGLEFPVVVLADAGRRLGGRGAPDVLLDRRGRVAIRACPDTGTTRPALGLKELGERREAGRARGGTSPPVRGHDPRPAAPDRERRLLQGRGRHAGGRALPRARGGAAQRGPGRGRPHTRGRARGGRSGDGRCRAAGRGARPDAPVRRAGDAAAGAARAAAAGRAPRRLAAPHLLQRPGAVRPLRLPVLRPAHPAAAGTADRPAPGRGHGRRRDRRCRAPAARARRRALARALPPRDGRGRGADRADAVQLGRFAAGRARARPAGGELSSCRSRSRSTTC